MIKLWFNQPAWSNCSSHFHGLKTPSFTHNSNIYNDALITSHKHKPGFLEILQIRLHEHWSNISVDMQTLLRCTSYLQVGRCTKHKRIQLFWSYSGVEMSSQIGYSS